MNHLLLGVSVAYVWRRIEDDMHVWSWQVVHGLEAEAGVLDQDGAAKL